MTRRSIILHGGETPAERRILEAPDDQWRRMVAAADRYSAALAAAAAAGRDPAAVPVPADADDSERAGDPTDLSDPRSPGPQRERRSDR